MGLSSTFGLVFALVFAPVALAQLERCSFGDNCLRTVDECRTLVGDELVPCPQGGTFCFCAPESVGDLEPCGSGMDCPENQRCGILPGSEADTGFCVGCRSVVVNIIPPNFCERPSQRPLPSPSATSGPTITPQPDIPNEDDDEDEEAMPSSAPVSTFVPSISPLPTITAAPIVSEVPAPPAPSVFPVPDPVDSPSTSPAATMPPGPVDSDGDADVEEYDPVYPYRSFEPIESPDDMPEPTLATSASPSTLMTIIPRPTRTPIPSSSAAPSFSSIGIDEGEDEDDEGDGEPSTTPEDIFGSDTSISPSISPSATPSLSVGTSPSISLTPSPSVSPEDIFGDENDGEPVPSEEPVCVDAAALSHLSSEELVFSSHRRAAVLCDSHGSCATPGHMVHYQGSAMMMRSYCELVGTCLRSVRWVNSPKFRRGLRVVSRTDGLSFLAFAARFESKAEEHVLRTLVHMGM